MKNFTITAEHEGQKTKVDFKTLKDFFLDMKKDAINSDHFINLVTLGVTNETSELSAIDKLTLRTFYLA